MASRKKPAPAAKPAIPTIAFRLDARDSSRVEELVKATAAESGFPIKANTIAKHALLSYSRARRIERDLRDLQAQLARSPSDMSRAWVATRIETILSDDGAGKP